MGRISRMALVVLVCGVLALWFVGSTASADTDISEIFWWAAVVTGLFFAAAWSGGGALISAAVSHKEAFSRVGATFSQPPVMVALILALAAILYALIPRYEIRGEYVLDRWTGNTCPVAMRVPDARRRCEF